MSDKIREMAINIYKTSNSPEEDEVIYNQLRNEVGKIRRFENNLYNWSSVSNLLNKLAGMNPFNYDAIYVIRETMKNFIDQLFSEVPTNDLSKEVVVYLGKTLRNIKEYLNKENLSVTDVTSCSLLIFNNIPKEISQDEREQVERFIEGNILPPIQKKYSICCSGVNCYCKRCLNETKWAKDRESCNSGFFKFYNDLQDGVEDAYNPNASIPDIKLTDEQKEFLNIDDE